MIIICHQLFSQNFQFLLFSFIHRLGIADLNAPNNNDHIELDFGDERAQYYVKVYSVLFNF